MDIITILITFFLHIDAYLASLVQQYGIWTYVILFIVIFLETGLVITPFLPGDSLLFVAGALAAAGMLDLAALLAVIAVAAILGDTVNYWIGYKLETGFLERRKLIKKEYIEKTHKFYDKYGAETIILARFIPIVRTFAPFVAGVGKMRYRKFLSYNIIGGVVWSAGFVLAGFYLGNVPIVKENLSIVLLGIIVVTLAAAVVEFVRHRR
ncbi:MAG: DedA family protein [Candidatus Aenigmarchaeota archaeon]|nr:DedA family protein [Candidatus Aenigmarchaeota archaeon]